MTATGTQSGVWFEVDNINLPWISSWVTTCPNGTMWRDSVTNEQYIINTDCDTIRVCLTYNLYPNGTLVFNYCCITWVWNGVFWEKMTIPTIVEETKASQIIDNKIYDLLGRVLKKAPKGIIYIKNNKKYLNEQKKNYIQRPCG